MNGLEKLMPPNPNGSVDKEFACHAGDTGDGSSIPRSGDPLEKEMATCSSIFAWKNPKDRGAWRATVHGITKNQT